MKKLSSTILWTLAAIVLSPFVWILIFSSNGMYIRFITLHTFSGIYEFHTRLDDGRQCQGFKRNPEQLRGRDQDPPRFLETETFEKQVL